MTKFKEVDVLFMDNQYKWHKHTVNTYSFKDWDDTFEMKWQMLNRMCNKGLIKDYQVET